MNSNALNLNSIISLIKALQYLKCGCKLLRTIFPILTSMSWLARCGVHHKIFKHLKFLQTLDVNF